MIQVIFRIQLVKLFVSINSTQANSTLIKSKLEIQKLFLFQPISKFDMEKEIQNIDLKKVTTKNTIPPKSCNTSTETLHISSMNV